MEILPVGEAIYSVNGRTYSIPAEVLKQHDFNHVSHARCKGDPEGWYMAYSARTEHGLLTWDIYFSVGMDGIILDSSDLVGVPDDVEIIRDMHFEEVQEELEEIRSFSMIL